MLRLISALVFVTGGAVAAYAAGDSAVVADYGARPVFPTAKAEKVVAPDVVPAGAQYRVRSGKAFKFVACDRQRVFAGGAVELGCLSFSKSKGWGKSVRWFPKYQLLPLKGEVSAEPVTTALR